MEEIVHLFLEIYSSSGFLGITIALTVLAIFVFIFSMIYSAISPIIIKKFKGDKYISFQEIAAIRERIAALEKLSETASNQREKLFDKVTDLEKK